MSAPAMAFVVRGSARIFRRCDLSQLSKGTRSTPIFTANWLHNDVKDSKANYTFDEQLLKHLCCPLSKKPLRYDKERNELISDEIGVAYSIVDGIPNLIPQDARTVKTNKPLQTESPSTSETTTS